MEKAATRAGMDDWGDLDFTVNLERFVESCRNTGALSPIGWRSLHRNVQRCLINRLHLQAYLAAHPGAIRDAIHRPVVITGLPRTGTTLLQSLLGQDPSNRLLRFWEALRPVPPDPTNGLSEAALVGEAQTWLDKLYEMAPDFRAVHSSGAQTPEECDVLFQTEFASWHFEVAFPADDYSSWLREASLFREYRSYVRHLQVLDNASGARSPWVLKSPSHLGHTDALLQSFSEPLIVQCHRHPVEAIPSFASLVMTVRTPYADGVSPDVVGEHALERFSTAMGRALRVRESADPARFLDVAYHRLISEPMDVVADIYGRLGRPLSGEARAHMEQWLAQNPQHKHGAHRYSLEQFGLTPETVTAVFAPYLERFEATFTQP